MEQSVQSLATIGWRMARKELEQTKQQLEDQHKELKKMRGQMAELGIEMEPHKERNTSTGEWRIVLLGKTGDGKSSTGNTILGEKVFEVDYTASAVTYKCESHSRTVNGKRITLIDTPGFFDTDREEKELECEIGNCLNFSYPGPHAFILVFTAARHSTEEKKVKERIEMLFTSEVFKYSVIVFTHGKDLEEGKTIQDFVDEKDKKGQRPQKDLADKCGSRYLVIDNPDWKEKQKSGETEEQKPTKLIDKEQIKKLFGTIEKMVQKNKGCYYTKKLL